MKTWYICFLNDVSFQSYQCLWNESLYMLWVLAFFGFVFCLFVSKEEISGHWAMWLSHTTIHPSEVGKLHLATDFIGSTYRVSASSHECRAGIKNAKCNFKMLVKSMYASKSNSAFFVKTGAVFVIHRLSGGMNRASICHIKRICCRWETWQAALACWCSPAGQLG